MRPCLTRLPFPLAAAAPRQLTTTYAYDARGNVTAETTRSEMAGHVPSRTARASNFVDGRHPGTVTDAAD